jgi:alpha-beta hydrolase superfamily lysophospholipase
MQISGDDISAAEVRLREIEVPAPDRINLRGRWWQRSEPRGVVVVSHGFGEHGGVYARTAAALMQGLDVDVVAVDYRGHGRSPGRRGVVRHYDDLVGDLRSVLDWVGQQNLPGPRFLLGHSNGGQVALRFLLQDPNDVSGAIISNPALRLALPVSPVKRLIGRFLLKFAPGVTLRGAMQPELSTSDPAIQEEHRTDPLNHSRMSAPLFFGMVAGGPVLLARACEIRVPILVLLGGRDPVIDPSASRAFYDRLGSDDKTLLVYPEMLHEPLNEVGRERVCDDIVRWIAPRL